MDPGPSYTVLRIKRKATDQPLSSLVIQDGGPSYPSSRDGLDRPKKRRDLSSRPKPRGVFKLADTVPDSWVGRGTEGEILQQRIKGLMGTGVGGDDVESQGKGKGKGKERAAEDSTNEEEAMNEPSAPPSLAPDTISTAGSSTPSSTSGLGSLQYRVIAHSGLGASVPRQRPKRGLGGGPNVPPVVRSYAEVEAEEQAKSLFRFIDAQAVSANAGKQLAAEEEEADPQMAAFQDMLNEYLTLERTEAARKEAEEEYVYDLYYRDVRDSSIALGSRAGDGGPSTSIGALIGFDDFSPPSSPSSSEPEDEADEDSNDEDFYRNDYPEDEDADEDMEGFDDAFASGEESDQSDGPRVGGVMREGDDGGGSDDGDDEGGGTGGRGGKWGYR